MEYKFLKHDTILVWSLDYVTTNAIEIVAYNNYSKVNNKWFIYIYIYIYIYI